MDERTNKAVTRANALWYDSAKSCKYTADATHIKHATLRNFYGWLAEDIYSWAAKSNPIPTILDLGAGEGSATLPFLELGAKVTAVDISENQLKTLQTKCDKFASNLEMLCKDAFDAIELMRYKQRRYDVVISNSFLHHIPDYISFIRKVVPLISPIGQFFSFQDPLKYDSLSCFESVFSKLAHCSWRIFQGDLKGGIKRRVRRSRGVYLEESPLDNVEYHVVRGGVDQDAIRKLLEQLDFDCQIIRYFSTQSKLCQPIGTALGVKNTFAVLARRKLSSIR